MAHFVSVQAADGRSLVINLDNVTRITSEATGALVSFTNGANVTIPNVQPAQIPQLKILNPKF